MPSTTFNITPSLGFGANLNLPQPAAQMQGAGPLNMDVFFKAQATQQGEKGLTQRAVQQTQGAASLVLRHKQLLDQQQRTNLYKEKHIFEQEKWLTEQMSTAAMSSIGQSLNNAQVNDAQNYGLDPTIPAQARKIEEINKAMGQTQDDMNTLATEFEFSRRKARDVGSYARKINQVKNGVAQQINTPDYQRMVALNKKHQSMLKQMGDLMADGGYIVNEQALAEYENKLNQSSENIKVPALSNKHFNPQRYLINVNDVRTRLKEAAAGAMGLTEEMAAIENVNTMDGVEAEREVHFRLRRDRQVAEEMLRRTIEADPELKYYVDNFVGDDYAKVILDQHYTAAAGNKIVTDYQTSPTGVTTGGGSSADPLRRTYGGNVIDNLDKETKQNLGLGDSYLRENGLDPAMFGTKDVIGLGSVSPNRIDPVRDANGNVVGFDIYPENVGRNADGTIDKETYKPSYRILPNPFLIQKQLEKRAAENNARKAREHSAKVNSQARGGMADDEFSNMNDASTVNPHNSLISRELGMFTDGTYDFVNRDDQGAASIGHYQFNGENANRFIDHMREKYPEAEVWESLNQYDFRNPLTEGQESAVNNALNNVAQKGGLTQDEFIREQTAFWNDRWGAKIHDEMEQVGFGNVMGNSAVQKFFYSTQNQSWQTENLLPNIKKRLGDDFDPRNEEDLRKLLNISAEERIKYVKKHTKNKTYDTGGTLHEALERRVNEERDEALKTLDLYEGLNIPINSSIEEINRLGDNIQVTTSTIGDEGQKKYSSASYYAPDAREQFEKAGIDIDNVREGTPLTQEEYDNYATNMLRESNNFTDYIQGESYKLPNTGDVTEPSAVPQQGTVRTSNVEQQSAQQQIPFEVKQEVERKVMSDDELPTDNEIIDYINSNGQNFKDVNVEIPYSVETSGMGQFSNIKDLDTPSNVSVQQAVSNIKQLNNYRGQLDNRLDAAQETEDRIKKQYMAKGQDFSDKDDYINALDRRFEIVDEINTIDSAINSTKNAIDEVRPYIENEIFFNGLTDEQRDSLANLWLTDKPIMTIENVKRGVMDVVHDAYIEAIPSEANKPLEEQDYIYRPDGDPEKGKLIKGREVIDLLLKHEKQNLVSEYGDRFRNIDNTRERPVEQPLEQPLEQQAEQTVNKVEKYGL